MLASLAARKRTSFTSLQKRREAHTPSPRANNTKSYSEELDRRAAAGKMKLLTLLFAGAAALAPTPKHIKATKPAALPYQLAAAATAFAPLAALAGGQAEGTGLALGIEDEREGYALLAVGGFMFAVFFRWSAEQPDADSDFFAEYDERRL